jgi:hypothetical protein
LVPYPCIISPINQNGDEGYGVISITQVFCVLGDNGVKNTLVDSLGFEVPKTSRKKIKRNTIRSSSCSRDLKIFGKCKI